MPDAPVSILLAEDQHLIREAIKLLLERNPQFKLVGEAADGLEAVALAERLKPDILITDLMVPRLHGLEVVRQVRRTNPKTRIVILSMHSDEPSVMEALRNGADAFVQKGETSAELLTAIKEVLEGRRYLSRQLADRAITGYIEHPGQSVHDVFDSLTARERLVLQMVAEGQTTAQIAKKLFISPRTVESHRSNLLHKLGLSSPTDLIRFAIRKGLIEP